MPFTNAARTLPSSWTVKNIKAGSLVFSIDVVTDNNNAYKEFDLDNQENWSAEENREFMNASTVEPNIELTMKDGTKLSTLPNSTSSEDSPDGKSKLFMDYFYCKDGDTSKPYTLNPDDIVSIKCSGIELIA